MRKCSRCYRVIEMFVISVNGYLIPNFVEQGGMYFHLACYKEGEVQLQAAEKRADEYARRFGFSN